MSTRWWMAAVAIAALMAWSTRLDGPYILAWEVPMTAAACAMWMVDRRRWPVAAALAGAAAGSVLAMGAGIGGASAASVFGTTVGIGGAAVGGMAGLFTAWLGVVGSCMLRSYKLPEIPDAAGPDHPRDPGRCKGVQGVELP